MYRRPARKTCLSAEPHENDIRDPLLHYLGCIEIYKREEFLNGKTEIWQKELMHQAKLKKIEDAKKTVENMKKSWQSTIENEMRRILFLRYTLSNDEHDKKLVSEVVESYKVWKESEKFTKNIDKVKEWRNELGKDNTVPGPEFIHSNATYAPERDISVPVIHFKDHEGFTTVEEHVRGKFPNQKMTIEGLLKDKMPSLESNHIRYFHIPSNNMIWAEEVIARYYGDEKPDLIAIQRQMGRPERNNTYMILQERYWRGQLHGDANSPPHARYMSPMCETVSWYEKKSNLKRDNIVLFMPYLHWDTSVRRQQFSDEIDEIVIHTARGMREEEVKAKERRRAEREKLLTAAPNGRGSIHRTRETTLEKQMEEFEDVVQESRKANENANEKADSKRRRGVRNTLQRIFRRKGHNPSNDGVFQCENALGCYLLAAARLYEGMTTYRDRMLLRKYLPRDPPIHPRRTLDQAFYWTLNSTKKRDRDQVVYRGTTVTQDNLHCYDHKRKEWPDHKGLDNRSCDICRDNMKKVSRVIMVDQLWMWILDRQTLITCFPKRYGANKQDFSGVHKSIRTSLESLGSNQPRTVFELALIVLDECTKTFFDRTRLLDRQPQVIDEFSKAIGNIMHAQTTAFTRLWRWTDDARKIFRSKGYTDTSGLHIPLLDIKPEGKLEREIEDIIEELDIMLHITNIHKDIVKSFIAQAEKILNPNNKFSKDFDPQPSKEPKLPDDQADYQSFKLRAEEIQERVDSHVKDLDVLRKSAKNTADDVLHLLTMKQQQASVVQAWQAVRQSDETIKQGRSIMVFTLATIVFLPLSFLTSVFGMNNQEFGGNKWRLKHQFLYICKIKAPQSIYAYATRLIINPSRSRAIVAISAGVVFISLLFAFSAWIRAWTWSFYSRLTIGFVTKTGIYSYFLGRKHSEQIFKDTGTSVNEMKMDKRKQVFEAKRQRRERHEERDRKSCGEEKQTVIGTPSMSSSGSTRFGGSLLSFSRRRKQENGNATVGARGDSVV
ncbi:hypothetical protein F5Y09DRAFT_352192 [Xylaria sp. FL1042]|nr:hypothetical protein F5Y09DRAFT_352192 [Xylaria sp. FL1042]